MGRLADAARADSKPYSRCKIAALRRLLDGEDLADLEELLADLSVPGSAIARQVTAVLEFKIGPDSVLRHRRGECACGTPD